MCDLCGHYLCKLLEKNLDSQKRVPFDPGAFPYFIHSASLKTYTVLIFPLPSYKVPLVVPL